MFDHQTLDIWHRSKRLAIDIHAAMRGRSRYAPPGQALQLSNACSSIATNIAEASGYSSSAQSVRFIDIALGSLTETQSHLEFAVVSGLIPKKLAPAFADELQQLRRMIYGFRKWLVQREE